MERRSNEASTAPAGRRRRSDIPPEPRRTSGAVVAIVITCRSVLAILVAMVAFTLAPAAIGWTPHLILTGSMEPSIKPGDIIVSSPIKPTDIQAGRILVMDNPLRPGELLTHRMVKANPDRTITTKGDANNSEDSTPVPDRNIRGLPRLRVPMIGLPALWVRDQNWAPLGIASASLLVLVWGATGRGRGGKDVGDEPAASSRRSSPAAPISA